MTAMENEITGPVLLCDGQGALNPAAVGWARHPHWDCNLRGRFGRKKRWDYWCFVGPERLFSVCFANIDYAGLVGAYVFDYASNRMADAGMALPFARQPVMPNGTRGKTVVQFGRTRGMQEMGDAGGVITFSSPRCQGKPLSAEFHIEIPPEQQTLNVVVPWSGDTFQFTSKQLPLACEGEVRWGEEVWTFDRATTFGVRDFGRGIWPFRTTWNWAALSARNGTDLYAVNLGGQWTDGTGATENGLMLNGRFYPIPQTVRFEYDRDDFMKPWRLHTPGESTVDLELTPFHDRLTHLNLGVLKTTVHQCFGHFRGTVRAGGQSVQVDGALGWAEEQQARW